jgi:hypothetical protein
MDKFNDKNNVSFDFDKNVYLELIESFYSQIQEAFLNKDIATFTDQMNKICYLALVKNEF